jgi:hypothetical protein
VRKQHGKDQQVFHVSIGAESFDPKEAATRARRRATAAKKRRGELAAEAGLTAPTEEAPEPVIVQFARELSAEDIGRLRDEYGLKLDQYIPNLAYLERVAPTTIVRLRRDPLVRASIPYHPELKLAPSIAGAVAPPPDDTPRLGEFDATLFDDGDPAAVESSLVALGARDIRILDDRAIGGRARVRFVLDEVANLARVADIEDVTWIERVYPKKDDNAAAAATIQSGSAALASIWDRGLHGEGQVIAVFDRGPLDINHCFFADAAPNTPGPAHRKVVALRNVAASAVGAHATFVAGCAAGNDRNNNGTHLRRGGAWGAKIASGNRNDLNTNSMLSELTANRTAGAFIHSNSWHDLNNPGGPAVYNQIAADVDSFTWANEDHLVIGSAGNNGEEQGPPGTAKNAICVGAAQADPNEMNFGDGNAGPTNDGRRKPDLMAVGCAIQSALPTTPGTLCATGPRSACATSYATPHVAAAAALVRQYFVRGYYPVGRQRDRDSLIPTGALLKALLLNTTVDMTGIAGYPSDTEGFGLLRIDRGLYFDGDLRHLRVWDVRHATGPTTGDNRTHHFEVANTFEPLKVTLVWSEPPPAAAAFANPVVNDLDLRVTAPDGTVYMGNEFTNGVSTPNANVAGDLTNNVEVVVVNNPPTGKWKIDVEAFRVSRGNPGQGYALVVTANLASNCFVGSAVYGNPSHPDVEFIRDWRDRVRAGGGGIAHGMDGLVALYARVGPPLARVVRAHPRVALLLRRRFFEPAVRRARARTKRGPGQWR